MLRLYKMSCVAAGTSLMIATKFDNFKKVGTLDPCHVKPTIKKLGRTQHHIYSCTYDRKKQSELDEHKIRQLNLRLDVHYPYSIPSFSRISVAMVVPDKYSDEFHKFSNDRHDAGRSSSTYDFHKTIKQAGDEASYDLNDNYFYMDFSYDPNENDLDLRLRTLIKDLNSLDSNGLQEIEKDIFAELSHLVPTITQETEEVVRQSSNPRPK